MVVVVVEDEEGRDKKMDDKTKRGRQGERMLENVRIKAKLTILVLIKSAQSIFSLLFYLTCDGDKDLSLSQKHR